MNLEKSRACQNILRKICCEAQEITDLTKISTAIFDFYANLFKEKLKSNSESLNNFLNDLSIPSLSETQKQICEEELTEKDIYESMIGFDNNKSPGNDGLTKEFYQTFWHDVKDIFFNSLQESKRLKYLCTSQRQVIIKLLEKPNKNKSYVSNWRPIFLLNMDQKIISKASAIKLKTVLPVLISPGQTAYSNGRFIGESGRLISDIIEICDIEKLSEYLMTIDFENTFDSMNHAFLIAAFKKYGFDDIFKDWTEILLKNQESCVINGGHTTNYFKIERGTRQGDPISAYLFILVLEIFFILIKTNKNIHGLKIFDHAYLSTAYADDTTLFLKDISSIKVVLKDLKSFSGFSGLCPNFTKCKIAGIAILKSVNVALCGMKCLDLTKECIKVLRVHISYNKKVQDNKNFCDTVKNIYNVIKL